MLTFACRQLFFQDTGVDSRPETASWQATFECSKPKGRVHVSFATGQKEEKPAIFWQTMVQSDANDLPQMPDEFQKWFDAAHEINDNWFFKLIEGELEEKVWQR